MVKQAVEHGADGGDIGEQFAPVIDGAVGCQHSAGPLVAQGLCSGASPKKWGFQNQDWSRQDPGGAAAKRCW